MSSYRGAGSAWDGGPPGAEADYVGQRRQVPGYEAPAPPSGMPTTDPWTGVSYSQYGAPSGYDYSAYSSATAAYGYSYDPSYYQQANGNYYGKYNDARSFATQSTFEYPQIKQEKTDSPTDSQRHNRRRSYNSKSRSVSPYDKRDRDSSFEDRHHRRSRSKTSNRKKYSSSERSSSGSPSYQMKKPKRNSSTDSSPDRSHKKKTKSRGRDDTPRSRHRSLSGSGGRTPSLSRSKSKSPSKQKKKSKPAKSSKEGKQRKVTTPPRKKKDISKSPNKQKAEKFMLTPPKVYKLKGRRSESPGKSRDRSLTPPKSYARSTSRSTNSRSGSPSPRYKRKRPLSRSSRHSRPRSYSRSPSSTSSQRSHSRFKHKNKRKSRSKSHSRRGSISKGRPVSHHSKSRGKAKRPQTPSGTKSRSKSNSSHSRSGTPSEDERRGQFTVEDRKRFWKLHRNRQEEKGREPKTPPKELKPPPPGAVENTKYDDIEYGDPPEVEGPNFAELLPTAEQVMRASSSKSKALPIPIKNDGSFLEMFKKMQEVTKKEESEKKPEIKKPALPFIGKRRGGRVLKTGLVKKAKAIDEQTADSAPKDAWSLYMQEVKKYRETSCEEERKTRPLVK